MDGKFTATYLDLHYNEGWKNMKSCVHSQC